MPDYESGGQELESLRARQHLATTYRAKIIGLLRYLQGSLQPRQTLPSKIRHHQTGSWSGGRVDSYFWRPRSIIGAYPYEQSRQGAAFGGCILHPKRPCAEHH